MKRVPLSILLLSAAAVAQIKVPTVGFMRDLSGALRPVLGITGSFVAGDALDQGVVSAGFGKTVGFAKKELELLVVRDGQVTERLPAPAGEARFYLGTSGEITDIYFPETQELWRVSKSGFQKLAPVTPPHSAINFENDDISFADGVRVRMPEQIRGVEWLSDSWVVVRGDRALYAVRAKEDAVVVQLPEAAP
jgi:hypothetical protein